MNYRMKIPYKRLHGMRGRAFVRLDVGLERIK